MISPIIGLDLPDVGHFDVAIATNPSIAASQLSVGESRRKKAKRMRRELMQLKG